MRLSYVDKKIKIMPTLAIIFLIIASASFAMASYMIIKAHIAQALLASTWQKQWQTVNNPTEINQAAKTFSKNKPWPWADFYPVAKLTFDRVNLSHIVLNNDSGQALAFGPGLNQSASDELEQGNSNVMVISAHNDTHFSILKELRLNDSVTLSLNTGKSRVFRVTKTTILDTATEQLVLLNTSDYITKGNSEVVDIKELVLVTCYPFSAVNSATSLRYVVYLS